MMAYFIVTKLNISSVNIRVVLSQYKRRDAYLDLNDSLGNSCTV